MTLERKANIFNLTPDDTVRFSELAESGKRIKTALGRAAVGHDEQIPAGVSS